MQETPAEDVSQNLDDEAREVMLDLVLQWARYDGLVSQWVLHAYGLSADNGALLLGNMDTKTKLDRLKLLYEHHQMAKAVSRIAELKKAHLALVGIRNLLAHAACGGLSVSDPNKIYFSPVKAAKGRLGMMTIEAHTKDDFRLAARFAREMSDQIYLFIQPLLERPSPPPPEPPEFLGESPATPQKQKGSRRPQQRRGSKGK